MIAFRTMTFSVQECRDRNGKIDCDRIGDIIHQSDVDIVALQGVNREVLDRGMVELPDRLGMAAYGLDQDTGLAFLSRSPLRALQVFDLGWGGRCLKTDYSLHDRRVHLFNFGLSFHLFHRKSQLEALQGEELLGNLRLPCPIVVHGDFSLPLPDPGQLDLSATFRRARFPRYRATYPARLPLWGRSRIYLQGEIKEIAGHIPMEKMIRRRCGNLPLILTLQLVDSRTPLKLEKPSKPQIRVISGQGAGCG